MSEYKRSMITIYFDTLEQELEMMQIIEAKGVDHDGVEIVPEVDEDGNVIE